jgi:hypothetical protein
MIPLGAERWSECASPGRISRLFRNRTKSRVTGAESHQEGGDLELNEILKIALKGGASDIHVKPGLPPMFRVDGALVPLKNGERLVPEDVEKMSAAIMNPLQKARFDETREVDLA